MSREELLQEYGTEIQFLERQIIDLLLESGVLIESKRMAIRINLARIKYLKSKIQKIKNEQKN